MLDNQPKIPVCPVCDEPSTYKDDAYRCRTCDWSTRPTKGVCVLPDGFTQHDAVDVAKTFMGWPFYPGGRSKVPGIDCGGLIALTARAMGCEIVDPTGYPMDATPTSIAKVLDQNFECDYLGYESGREVPKVSDLSPGDVVLLWIKTKRVPRHVAIVGENEYGLTMIHTLMSLGRVCEHGWSDWWEQRIAKAYRWRKGE